MNAVADEVVQVRSAAERSAVYRVLAEAFTYSGAQSSAFGISGADYNDAFDPSVNEAACSLREGAHGEEDQSSLFEELMRFYEFFGLGRGEGVEMPDHLSVELEFMHYLTHLEHQVLDQPDDLVSVRLAQHDFIERHVARLVNAVCSKLDTRSASCIALVETCAAFINAERALVKQYAQA